MAEQQNFLAPSSLNALTDVINRGTVAGTLGGPVDVVTTLMRPFGYSVEAPVGGSEWIGQQMERTGMVTPTRRPLAELASSLALPAGALATRLMSAAKDAQAARQAALKAESLEQQMLGLRQAQEANTYFFNGGGPGSRYGRSVGYPQPTGTPVEKLFSNFAYEKHNTTPEGIATFREKLFNRALSNPGPGINTKVNSTVLPFREGMDAVVDFSPVTKQTRVQIVKDGQPIAAARIHSGDLDAIGVSGTEKGQDIGYDLLKFLHENNLANVYEVADRSPGFVKIQKRLLQEIGIPEMHPNKARAMGQN